MKVAYNNIDGTDWEVDTVLGVQAMQRVQPANEDAESSDEDGGIEAGINGHARGRDGAGPAKRMAPGLIGSLALGGAATWAGLTVFTRLSEPPGGGSVALATPPQTEAVAPHTQPPPPAGSMVEAQPSITPMARHTKRQRVSCRASGFNEVATRGGGSSTPGACWSLEQMLQHASEHGGGHCFFAATRAVTLQGMPCSESMYYCDEPLEMFPANSGDVYSICEDAPLIDVAVDPTEETRSLFSPPPPTPPPPPPPSPPPPTPPPPPPCPPPPPRPPAAPVATPFVTVSADGRGFVRNGKPFRFLGANLWYGAYLGSKGEGGDRSRLVRELDDLISMGVRHVRVVAGSQGPDDAPYRMVPSMQPALGEYNRDMLEGLDYLLMQLARRGMVATVMLNNFMPWSGGMAQFVAWSQDTTVPFSIGGSVTRESYFTFVQQFYMDVDAMEASYAWAEHVIGRRNALSGVEYKNDPTIMAWEMANAPRAMSMQHEFRNWVRRFGARIKGWDATHLVTVGHEGSPGGQKLAAGNDFRVIHSIDEVDFATVQIWPNDWGWYAADNAAGRSLPEAVGKCKVFLEEHLSVAEVFRKPLVINALGLVRDNGAMKPETKTDKRDEFLKDMLYEVVLHVKRHRAIGGVHFWGWAGEGRPDNDREDHRWRHGDPPTGDPPDTLQGRFSIFDQDASTRAVLVDYAKQINFNAAITAVKKELDPVSTTG